MSSQLDLRDKIRERASALPDFAVDCLFSLESSKSLNTLFEYIKDWSLFFDFLEARGIGTAPLSPEDMDKVTERDLLAFFDSLTRHSRSYTTATGKAVTQTYRNGPQGKARKLASVRILYTYLIRRKLLSQDPTRFIEFKIPAKNRIRGRLTRSEVESYFAAILEKDEGVTVAEKRYADKIMERDYVISLLFAYTGLRVSELTGLNLPDITINKKEGRSHLVITRKGGDEQAIAMPEMIVDDVADYIETRKAMTDIPSGENALFLSLRKRRLDPRSVREMIAKYARRAGITKGVTPHVFRRTFGTRHYNTYGDMYLTAKVLGHSSAETTRRSYADPDEERERESMKGFNY